jgi:hypothetical protein
MWLKKIAKTTTSWGRKAYFDKLVSSIILKKKKICERLAVIETPIHSWGRACGSMGRRT